MADRIGWQELSCGVCGGEEHRLCRNSGPQRIFVIEATCVKCGTVSKLQVHAEIKIVPDPDGLGSLCQLPWKKKT